MYCRRAYQAVAVERGVNGAEEEPARPQVLQPELENKVSQKHHDPHGHELQEGVCARTKEGNQKTQNKQMGSWKCRECHSSNKKHSE